MGCNRLVERTLRDSDTKDERRLKRIMVPVYWWLGLASFLSLLLHVDKFGRTTQPIGLSVFVFTLWGCVGASLTRRVPPLRVMETALVGCVIAILLLDINKAADGEPRRLLLIIPVIDMCLVANASHGMILSVLGIVLVYLGAERVEAITHYGLHRVALFGRKSTFDMCNCSTPPCDDNWEEGIADWVIYALVLLCDYHLTRSFAKNMYTAQHSLESSNDVAEVVAVCLSEYRTADARAVVDGEAGAPLQPRMRHALQRLLRHLESYRPYLPEAVLQNARPQLGGGANRIASAAAGPGDTLNNARFGGGDSGPTDEWDTVGQSPLLPDIVAQPGPAAPAAVSGLMPKLKMRMAGLLCARLRGLRENYARLPGDAVEMLGSALLAAVLDAAGTHNGMLYQFEEGAAIIAFGATDGRVTACADAVCCALAIRRAAAQVDDAVATILREHAPPADDTPQHPLEPPRREGSRRKRKDGDSTSPPRRRASRKGAPTDTFDDALDDGFDGDERPNTPVVHVDQRSGKAMPAQKISGIPGIAHTQHVQVQGTPSRREVQGTPTELLDRICKTAPGGIPTDPEELKAEESAFADEKNKPAGKAGKPAPKGHKQAAKSSDLPGKKKAGASAAAGITVPEGILEASHEGITIPDGLFAAGVQPLTRGGASSPRERAMKRGSNEKERRVSPSSQAGAQATMPQAVTCDAKDGSPQRGIRRKKSKAEMPIGSGKPTPKGGKPNYFIPDGILDSGLIPQESAEEVTIRGIDQGVVYDQMMTGEQGTRDRKAFTIMGPALAAVRALADRNAGLGTSTLCTARCWRRVQNDSAVREWVDAHEVAGAPGVFELSAVAAVSPNKTKGKLAIVETAEIGRGGFGTVFRALGPEGELLAVKHVNLGDASAATETRKEYEVMRRLQHPNVVRVIDLLEGKGGSGAELCIVMEFMAGGSIADMMGEFGPLRTPTCKSYTAQALAGLAHLHAKHIIHSDLKPDNLLVQSSGAVKLSDFGLCRRAVEAKSRVRQSGTGDSTNQRGETSPNTSLDQSLSSYQPSTNKAGDITRVDAPRSLSKKDRGMSSLSRGMIPRGMLDRAMSSTSMSRVVSVGGGIDQPRGTVHYMSPILLDHLRYSPQSDLWALGCCVLEMATAQMPWADRDFGPDASVELMDGIAAACEEGDRPTGAPGSKVKADKPVDGALARFAGRCFDAEDSGVTTAKLLSDPWLLVSAEELQ